MTESTSRRRVWIRAAVILFLVAILLLTFFSQTILNRSLPEVSVQYPTWDTVSPQITATGSVRANQTYDVTVEQTRTVAEVRVRVGQTVEAGDVLFTLTDAVSAELDAARRLLDDLRIQLIQKQKNDPSRTVEDTVLALTDELAAAEDSLASLNRQLKALSDRQGKIPTFTEINSAKAAIAREREQISYYAGEIERLTGKRGQSGGDGYFTEAELAALLADARDAVGEAEYYLTDAMVKMNEAKRAFDQQTALLAGAQKAYDEAAAALREFESSLPSGSVTWEQLNQQLEALEEQKGELERAKVYFNINEYNTAKAEYEAARADYDKNYAKDDAETRAARKKRVDDAAAVYRPLESEYLRIQSMEKAYASAQTAYQQSYMNFMVSGSLASLKAQEESARKNVDVLTSARDEAEQKYTEAKKICDDWQSAVKDAEGTLARYDGYRAYEELTAAIRDAEESKAAAETRLAEAEAVLLMAEEEQQNALTDEIASVQKQIRDTQRKIDTANRRIEETRSDAALDKQQYEIELARLEESIKKQQETVDRMAKTEIGGTVTSPVSGTVASIAYTVGQEIPANTSAARITLTDAGYTMELSLSAQQAARVKVGDTAEIRYYYWGETPKARVVSVKSAPGGSQMKTVTLEITGQVEEGTSLTVALGGQGQSYDCVIPSAAIREDQNGTFVLVVTAKNTPLGSRYTARRADVEVIVSDETKSAVTGEISGQYVITASAVPVSAGDAVRLKEEG